MVDPFGEMRATSWPVSGVVTNSYTFDLRAVYHKDADSAAASRVAPDGEEEGWERAECFTGSDPSRSLQAREIVVGMRQRDGLPDRVPQARNQLGGDGVADTEEVQSMDRVRACVTVLLLAVALGLSACAYPGAGVGTTQTSPPTPVPCPNSTASTAAARHFAHLTDQPMHAPLRVVPITTLPPGVSVGEVSVTVLDANGGPLKPSDTIFVYVGNGLSQAICTTDHHSECTAVTLERQVSADWQPVAPCLLATPTQIAELGPIESFNVRLEPSVTGAQSGAWPTGTYRVALTYHLAADGPFVPPEQTISSPIFTVT